MKIWQYHFLFLPLYRNQKQIKIMYEKEIMLMEFYFEVEPAKEN